MLRRYIEYVAGRVNVSGGDASNVPPSLEGYPPRGAPDGGPCHIIGLQEASAAATTREYPA